MEDFEWLAAAIENAIDGDGDSQDSLYDEWAVFPIKDTTLLWMQLGYTACQDTVPFEVAAVAAKALRNMSGAVRLHQAKKQLDR